MQLCQWSETSELILLGYRKEDE